MCYHMADVYDYAGATATPQPRQKGKKKAPSFCIFPDCIVFIIIIMGKMLFCSLKHCAVSFFFLTPPKY